MFASLFRSAERREPPLQKSVTIMMGSGGRVIPRKRTTFGCKGIRLEERTGEKKEVRSEQTEKGRQKR